MLGAPPVDLVVTDSTDSVYGATLMWAKDGLAGCRFHLHQSLDAVAGLMTRPFRLSLAPPRPADPPAESAG